MILYAPHIEYRILPLVNAINQTGLFRTISSCQGHFAPGEQTINDRNRADVRFERRKGVSGKSAQCDHLYPVEVDHLNPEQTDQANPVQIDHPLSCI